MKVGILTFHRTINYGSFLQSYSLAQALKKYTGLDVEIIDYNMLNVELYLFLSILSKQIKDIPKRAVQYRKFKVQQGMKLPLSRKRIISNGMGKIKEFLDKNYDVIIVGSDEVWKIHQLRGFPNIYWLHDDMKCLKLSYAASANRTRFDKLDELQKAYIRDSLGKFSYIGVRDENTRQQLSLIDNDLNIQRNSDPTFMFELSSSEPLKRKLIEKYKLDLSQPIMGIMCSDDAICQNIYQKYGREYQIVSLYVNTKYCHTYLYDLDPFEWANVFPFLKVCVTNFFHCTVFSILNQIPFISIDTEPAAVVFESKIKDLLNRADLLKNYFNIRDNSFHWNQLYKGIENCIRKPEIEKMQSMKDSERQHFFAFVKEFAALVEGKSSRRVV